ncbi:iron-containing alcohol dehydrogenase [Chryseolinea sp. H1M3-3]|uniref:iron-containing alcohol dehydrogenase n=1 Tax=Chryseolinea sp. H1M3-3 TaxID=3034144 RepID=UPI0023ECD2B6|nr:iron-containing alcohol dehydrogenase [Chryseolinea sp. H1M3-3]
MQGSFNFSHTPQLHFGPGKISDLLSIIKPFGSKILLITGAKSFTSSPYYKSILEQLQAGNIFCAHHTIDSEPSPRIVDDAVRKYAHIELNVIIAIGGGSVLDAGKAISAMLPLNEPVKNYLEGVGTQSHPGKKVAFIAVPTTAGTGSEATKNAVISETGEFGYKKSLRHNNFVPNVAIVDPMLTRSCTPAITASSGMDAFTQLLESYLSTTANPMTDALAYKGLRYVSDSLRACYQDGTNLDARTGMALAAYLSGITLANAGLGLVHGFAGAIGGYFPISHGVICSSLMTATNKITVRKLRREKNNDEALAKYVQIGKLFAGNENRSDGYYIDYLLDTIQVWAEEMKIPRLRQCGIDPTHFGKIVQSSDNKNNPVALNAEEMLEVLTMAN